MHTQTMKIKVKNGEKEISSTVSHICDIDECLRDHLDGERILRCFKESCKAHLVG